MDNNKTDVYATSEEVILALENLSKADKIRLNSFAKFRILELKYCNWEDLLSIAIERVIAGTRKWPKKISFIQFMGGCIRSIASEIYEKEKERKCAGIFSENTFDTMDESDSESIIDSVASEQSCPEADLIAKQTFENLQLFFEQDEDAFNVLVSKEDGYSPAEIQKSLGISSTQYATILKRISRKLPTFQQKERQYEIK